MPTSYAGAGAAAMLPGSSEDRMLQQLWANLQNAQKKSVRPDNEEALDEYPDDPRDALGTPIPCMTVLKDGKYHKLKVRVNLEETYLQDKGYLQWVRSRIGPTSSMEMQKLRLYIGHRDGRKKKRMEEELQIAENHQQPRQMMHAGRGGMNQPQARNLPKPMKTRRSPEYEENMEVDGWGVVQKTVKSEEICETWKAVTEKLMHRQVVKTKDMETHLQLMDQKCLATMMMNMIYM